MRNKKIYFFKEKRKFIFDNYTIGKIRKLFRRLKESKEKELNYKTFRGISNSNHPTSSKTKNGNNLSTSFYKGIKPRKTRVDIQNLKKNEGILCHYFYKLYRFFSFDVKLSRIYKPFTFQKGLS